MNPQAEALNVILESQSKAVYSLFSDKGKNIFFPKKGILGQSAEAKGKRINATIGEAVEDDGTPMRLKSIEKLLSINPALTFPYAPSYGRPDLRTKWKELLYVKNPALKGIDVSTPVITNALTHGLSIIGFLFLNPSDKVIMPDLNWDNYSLIFENAFGAELDIYNTFKNNKLDLDSFKDKLMAGPIGKKVVLLNFPNNPTGYTPTIDEAKEITKIIKTSAEAGNKLVIICDDAYFGLVFEDGVETQSIFAYIANIHENVLAVKLDGATKEDYVWGFRVGFISYSVKGATTDFYNAMADKTAGAVRANISNASNLSQSIVLKAYESDTYWQEKKEKFDILKSRYLKVKESLKNPVYKEYFEALPYNSGYFMCVKPKNGLDAEKIRQILLKEYETGVIVMSNILRIAFSSVSQDKIPQIFENIYQACKKA